MRHAQNLVGQQFGDFTIIELDHVDSRHRRWWKVRDGAGHEFVARSDKLCELNRPRLRPRYGRGWRGHPEYSIWVGLRARCRNPKDTAYKWYGARGIAVCDRWQNSFAAFIADMGPRPSLKHSIDRIDNDGNYEPGNCRWATTLQQSKNRRPRSKRAA